MRQVLRIGWVQLALFVIVIKQNNLLDILSAFCFVQIPSELPVIILKQAVHDVPEEKKTSHLRNELFYVIIFDLKF